MAADHARLIQDVITRMAQNTFTIKSLGLTILSAIITLGIKENKNDLLLLSMVISLVFWCLDGYYLMLERKFRRLYELMLSGRIPDLSLDTSNVIDISYFYDGIFRLASSWLYFLLFSIALVSISFHL